jgi:uncharacterized protein YbaR (Trm112 family)
MLGGATSVLARESSAVVPRSAHRLTLTEASPCATIKAVMISQDLLDMLVCPVCKKPVVLNANGQSLKCGVCRRVYPIQDDIPIMLVDSATIDPA